MIWHSNVATHVTLSSYLGNKVDEGKMVYAYQEATSATKPCTFILCPLYRDEHFMCSSSISGYIYIIYIYSVSWAETQLIFSLYIFHC